MRDYYLSLFSNLGGSEFDKTNQPNSFRTKFLSPLEVEPFSEISLCEISWLNSFSNLNKGNLAEFQLFDFLHKNPDGTYGMLHKFSLGSGFFPDPDSISAYINVSIWSKVERLRGVNIVVYDAILKRFWFRFEKDRYFTLILIKKMVLILGVTDQKQIPDDEVILGKTKNKESFEYKGTTRHFSDHTQYISSTNYTDIFQYPPAIDKIDCFFVHTDCITDQITGSEKTSLLRVVTLKGEPNTRANICYPSLHYLPLIHMKKSGCVTNYIIKK